MGEENNNYINGYVRDQNNHPISFDTEGNLVDQVSGEKGTMILPGFNIIGISPKTRARNYSSAYHPESSLEFFDIMTRPLTRPFSISQQIGAIRNKINGGTYWGSLLGNEENLGVVSKNFNKEHPYLSTITNIGADVVIPGISKLTKFIPINGLTRLGKAAYKASKVTGTKLGKNLLGNSFKKGFNYNESIAREAMKDVHDYVSSPDYLAQDFVKRNKSPYSIDIANHMYGLDESLNFVDYRAMNDYGKIFNERIKKTLPLAKQRGTLRTDKNPTIIVADSQGRQFLQNRFFEELNKVNGIHYGDPITPTGILAKKYYYKTSPAKDMFDIDPASFADRKNNTIVLVPSSGDYENMYKYTLPHEKTHIFIDGRKEVALFGDDRGFGALPRRDGYIDIDLDLYLNRPDEQLARGTQIKNYLGIVDESPITPEQLKYAAQNYVKDTGYDNNMTDFFRSIKDYKKAAKWLSLAPSVSPIIKTYSND